MQAKYPVVLFLPEDQHAFEVGQATLESLESLPVPDLTIQAVNREAAVAVYEAAQRLADAGVPIPIEFRGLDVEPNRDSDRPFGVMKQSEVPPRSRRPSVRAAAESSSSPPLASRPASASRPSRTPGATLYRAFHAYQQHLQKEQFRPETDQVSPW